MTIINNQLWVSVNLQIISPIPIFVKLLDIGYYQLFNRLSVQHYSYGYSNLQILDMFFSTVKMFSPWI